MPQPLVDDPGVDSGPQSERGVCVGECAGAGALSFIQRQQLP